MKPNSPYLLQLKDRINLSRIPFSERSSRLLIFHSDNHFTIRLAERWFKLEGGLSTYRNRPPLVDNWVFTDGDGVPLELDVTTYPHGIECATRIGEFSITFADMETLLVTLPAELCGMEFEAHLDKARADRRGGLLSLVGEVRRSIAYTTNARILRHETRSNGSKRQSVSLALDASSANKSLLMNITPRLGFNRHVPQAADAIKAADQRWHEWFAAAPAVKPEYQSQYYYAWWVMRAGLISSRFYTTREAMIPSLTHYVGVWQWDAYFHALAYRYIDKQLAQDQIRIMLDHQREDGMIPDAVHDEGTVTHLNLPVDADVTKPPLLAWAVWKLYQMDNDREFLDEVYEPMVRWNSWWFAHSDLDRNGLCEYQHPYSSGLDDSPLWDDGIPVESPDLNTYLFLQQEALARIAKVIGMDEDAQLWERRAQSMVQRMIRLRWDAQAGIFWATRNGARVNVRTPFNLFPLLTGRLPPEITDRLVSNLTDPRQFWTKYPVPTVAADESKYDPGQMWRGPTWININYLLIEGLRRSGKHKLAQELRRRTLELISRNDDIYEFYHPETGEPSPKAASTFGWSSAIFIDLAIQATNEVGED
ncbi:MAG: trehalase family glycosidase [Anaerolineales bacterium]